MCISMQGTKLTIMYSLLFLLLLGDGQVSIILKCFPCDFQRAKELFSDKCLQSADHRGVVEQQLVCRSSKMEKLVAINPLLGNKERMREENIRYAFKHSQANCHRPNGKCIFPHSYIEEEAWNVLLYGSAPQQQVGVGSKFEECYLNSSSNTVPRKDRHCVHITSW